MVKVQRLLQSMVDAVKRTAVRAVGAWARRASWFRHRALRGALLPVVLLVPVAVWALSWSEAANDAEAVGPDQGDLLFAGGSGGEQTRGRRPLNEAENSRSAPSKAPVRWSFVPERDGSQQGARLSSFSESDVTYQLLELPVALATEELIAVDASFSRSLEQILEAEEGRLAFNGGYWDVFQEPEGLVVSQYRTEVGFNPSLGGGILEILGNVEGGLVRLWDAENPPRALESSRGDRFRAIEFAVQCKPRLVVRGDNNIRRDDGNRAARTALGIRDEQLVVVLSRGAHDRNGRDGPSLYGLARQLTRLGYRAALNLDGGPSSGVVWRRGDAVSGWQARTPLRMVFVVRPRNAATDSGRSP